MNHCVLSLWFRRSLLKAVQTSTWHRWEEELELEAHLPSPVQPPLLFRESRQGGYVFEWVCASTEV